jgi:hypothetical protein
MPRAEVVNLLRALRDVLGPQQNFCPDGRHQTAEPRKVAKERLVKIQ